MATSVLPNDDSDINIDDKHLEIFCLVWLDANVKETRDTEQKLRSIINHMKKFQDVKQCQQFIEQRSQKDRLVLVVNGQLGREIVPSIHKLRQVMSIYVYCMDKENNEPWASTFPKVKGVIVELDALISRITADHKIQKKVEEPLSINIFTTIVGRGKSTTGINGQFVFSQILIDCLLRLKSTQTDKNELINLCQNEYEGNHSELDNLREFQEEYLSNKVLWWYTRESFFYKTLNAALRTQNIHMIFLFRKFISDIHRQLQDNQENRSLRVYRSQLMSNDELVGLKRHIGQFISVNSFFSTSKTRTTALFLLGDATSVFNLERVLFEIDADPLMVTAKPFADISQHSHFTDESEVLFMLGSIFRLQNIIFNEDQIWTIQMTLCGDNEHDLKQVLFHMKQQIGDGEINLRTFGKFLWKMGKLDLAEQYFKRFLTELSSTDPLVCNLYEDLSELASIRENYDMMVEWQQKSLTFEKPNQLTVNSNSNRTDNSIGQPISLSHININTKWKQNGITVAGGNGKGRQLNQLFSPCGIYVDDNVQCIYIADWGNDRIVEWKFGTKIGQVVGGKDGRRNAVNQLNDPTVVTVDKKNDSLIICDWRNSRVVEWPRQNPTDGRTIISDIDGYGVTMDNNGDLYVSDYEKNEVQRWKRGEANGTIVAGGNGKGSHLNQLYHPTYIFVDENYSVYVSDCDNHRVIKWTKDAKKGIVVAGGQGQGKSLTQLHQPHGVIVDHWGHVYVADSGNDRIIRWSPGCKEGNIIVGGNGKGQQPNQFNAPVGFSFDNQGNLYVVDSWNNRVQQFDVD